MAAGLERVTALLVGLLRGHPGVAHPDSALAADVIVRTTTGALQQAVLPDRSFPRRR